MNIFWISIGILFLMMLGWLIFDAGREMENNLSEEEWEDEDGDSPSYREWKEEWDEILEKQKKDEEKTNQ